MDVHEYLNRLSGTAFVLMAFGLVILVGSVDYLTGEEINLVFLYLIPVTLIAWFMSRRDGLIIAVIAVIASLTVESMIGHFYSAPVFLYWNASLRLVSFMLVATVLARMKFSFDENSKLMLDIQIALAKINTFTSRNPICAWCQRVRNEEGHWQGFNSYVKERSIIEVSHGICPACLKRFEKVYLDAGSYTAKVLPFMISEKARSAGPDLLTEQLMNPAEYIHAVPGRRP